MRAGRMSDDDWTRMARRMSEISEAPLFIDDSPNLTLMEIRAKARRLKQRNDLKLVILDYLQLMTSGRKVESRQQEVCEFSRQIKLLAKELEVPVVAISQLNRGPEQRTDKRPMLSDLRESGCVTAGTRLLRADTGAEVTIGDLLASGERGVRAVVGGRADADGGPRGHRRVPERGQGGVPRPPGLRPRGRGHREPPVPHRRRLVRRSAISPSATASRRRGRIPAPARARADAGGPRWCCWRTSSATGRSSSVSRCGTRARTRRTSQAVGDGRAARFGITAVRDEYAAARCTTLRLPAPYQLTHGRRNPIAAWLDELGLFGLRSHEKFVPAPVFALPDEQVALFLRHLWATDGCV